VKIKLFLTTRPNNSTSLLPTTTLYGFLSFRKCLTISRYAKRIVNKKKRKLRRDAEVKKRASMNKKEEIENDTV